MIRVMLVDDEPFVRMAIKTIFHWDAYGFEIVAEANNGEAAIQKLKQVQPDLLFTDLRMPIIDGVKLIAYVKQNYPAIRSVVLSNYDDFDLTRSAFLAGAVDYLLKNDFNEQSFAQLVQRLKERYFQEPSAGASPPSEAPLSRAEQKAETLRQLVLGTMPPPSDDIRRLQESPCVLCKISLMRKRAAAASDADNPLIQGTVYKILAEISEFQSYYYAESQDAYVVLFSQGALSDATFSARLHDFFESLAGNLSRYLNAATLMSVGAPVDRLEALPAAYEQAAALAQKQFYSAESELLLYRALEKPFQAVSRYVDQNMGEFSGRVRYGDAAYFTAFFDELFGLTREHVYPPDKLKHLIGNLIFLIKTEVLHSKPQPTETLSSEVDGCLESVMNAAQLEQVKEAVRKALDTLLGAQPSEDYSPIIRQVIHYLHEHYQDSQVTLVSTAKAVSVNASYLSRLFATETGEGFNHYLTALRLEHARRALLTTRESVGDIAEQNGYASAKYFVNLFKKSEGVTPSVYRHNGGALAGEHES